MKMDGSISYYNKELERYKVDYKEDSDYIGPDEIDRVEIML